MSFEANIETLARIAAERAGVDPDRHVEEPGFSGPAWQSPKYLAKAEAAYKVLTKLPYPDLP